MKKFTLPYKIICFLFLAGASALPVRAQFGTPVSDPMPDIPQGDLAIELEDWVTIPPSASGTPTARISVFRTTPDGRYWVNDLRGKLWVIENNTPVEYMDLEALIGEFIDSPGLGTGFHSFAFHPEFLSNGKFYTTHSAGGNSATPDFTGKATSTTGQQGVITEWTVGDPAANSFSGTSRELMRIQFPGNLHCLQEINFRPTATPADEDYGLLYICVGDGGSYNAGEPDNTHRLDSPYGAVLRIDPFGNNSANGQYGNPSSNPWADDGDPDTLGEIYAYGFRNPHRLTWDRGGDGLALVGGIGERNIEEVNILMPGADYGWPLREGTFVINPNDLSKRDFVYPLPENDAEFGFTYPAAQYDHDEGFAIIGGYVYRGSEIPYLEGKYIFGDIRNGRVFYLEAATLESGKLADIFVMKLFRFGTQTTLPAIVGRDRADLRFGEGHNGELFIMTKTDGKIRKVIEPQGASGVLDPNPEDFEAVANFETEEARVGSIDGDKMIINDPFSGSANKVLSIGPGSSPHFLDLAGGVPVGGLGTLYFRFALSDEATAADFGFSHKDSPRLDFDFNGLNRITAGGALFGRDRLTMVESEVQLAPGKWYEAWLVMDTFNTSYELHLRGGNLTAPVTVSGPLAKFSTSPLEVRTFGIKPGFNSGGAIYIDDIHLDDRDLNFSSPLGGESWRLVSNLDNAGLVESWGAWGAGGTPAGSLDIGTELNGNTVAVASFGQGGNATTFIRALPIEIDVGTNLILFARVLPSFSPNGERIGIRSSGSEQNLADDIDANLDLYVRFLTNQSGERVLHVRDGESEVPAMMPDNSPIVFAADSEWMDLWIVARNGGKASGGQTYDVYLQADQLGDAAIMVAENADFRQGQEIPLVAAVVHSTADGQSFSFDDFYMILGQSAGAPVNLGDEFFPNPLGEKEIPWFGNIDDSSYPFIRHASLGWLYAPGPESSPGIWAYDYGLGWIYIDPITFPYIYALDSATWLLYLQDSADPRWFFDFAAGQWLNF